MVYDQKLIAERLKELLQERIHRDFKAISNLERAGIRRAQLESWTEGKSSPAPENLRFLAAYLEVPLSYLTGRTASRGGKEVRLAQYRLQQLRWYRRRLPLTPRDLEEVQLLEFFLSFWETEREEQKRLAKRRVEKGGEERQ